MIIKGKYQHYKGNFYQVLSLAFHSETNEELVIYQEIKKSGPGKIWARPRKMFEEEVLVAGQKKKRFILVEKNQ